ncbi:MAG: restriction endonuclease subunit S [Gallionellaceae bacterium]|nr:MAG: restriction endonuclease subunit S [Gallionellaceae bacterium]
MKIAAYKRYKPSDSTWLPIIPDTWQQIRGRFVMSVNPASMRLRNLDDSDEVSFVPMEAVGENGGLNLDRTKLLDEIGSGYTEFEDGDVVIAKITPCFENGKSALASGLKNGVALGTTELHVLRASKRLNNRFLFHLTTSHTFRMLGEAEMYGAGGQKRVPPEFVKNFCVPLPPLEEQQTIADFLDAQTAKIDTLLAKKRQFIDKLKEKRSALIARTVTRGLPPAAAQAAGLGPHLAMKVSGVEWLGHIPAHWEIKRLRYIGEAIIGLTYAPEDVSDEEDGTLVLRSSNVQAGKITLDDTVYVKKAIPKHLRTRVGDILICSRNGSRALIGKNAMIDERSAGLTFGAFMTIFRSKFSTYLYWVFNSNLFEFQSGAFLTSTINQLTVNNLYSFAIAFPPSNEQQAIAAYLDCETARIAQLAAKVEAAIARLTEYRQALITAAVMGKIAVRARTV